MEVPFFRPSLSAEDIEAVVECLRSGWVTTGPRVKEFEARFATYVGAEHAVAVNSCTAALHLALEAVGLQRDDLVLVPTMTFAATAEVVRYFDAIPVFVDSEPESLCMDPALAESTLAALDRGEALPGLGRRTGSVRAIIPVHYGGQMADVDAFQEMARRRDIALIEDAAHALPAFHRSNENSEWRAVGTTADITCFSFYANKCITTGEGGMAVTSRADWADRMRIMSLHGMSRDAWKRFSSSGSWAYEIVAPGFKYNLTDVAAAMALGQLARADELWQARRAVAKRLREGLSDVDAIELPRELPNRRHSWHLFSVRLRLDRLQINRAEFIEQMKASGVAASVHYQPLHMQPYYANTFGYVPEHFPVAHSAWPRLVSLPIFPGMSDPEMERVIEVVRDVATRGRAR